MNRRDFLKVLGFAGGGAVAATIHNPFSEPERPVVDLGNGYGKVQQTIQEAASIHVRVNESDFYLPLYCD